MNICEYGCGREAKYFFKHSKKWCCEKIYNRCPAVRLNFIKNNPSKKEEIKKKKVETYRKNLGVDHPMFSKEIKDKIKKTCIEKYGVSHPLMNEDVKEKVKNTHKERYGKHYTKTDEYKEKSKMTCMERYGVNSHNKSEKVKENKENSCKDKYGVINVFQLEEIKEKSKNTMLKKYGVEYNLQRSEMKKHQYKYKKYIMPSGKNVLIQGNENIAIDDLLKKYNETDIIIKDEDIEKEIGKIWYFNDGKKRRYFPDIFIKSKNKIIEVKSKYTYEVNEEINLLKKDACLKNEYDFDFMIIN